MVAEHVGGSVLPWKQPHFHQFPPHWTCEVVPWLNDWGLADQSRTVVIFLVFTVVFKQQWHQNHPWVLTGQPMRYGMIQLNPPPPQWRGDVLGRRQGQQVQLQACLILHYLPSSLQTSVSWSREAKIKHFWLSFIHIFKIKKQTKQTCGILHHSIQKDSRGQNDFFLFSLHFKQRLCI